LALRFVNLWNRQTTVKTGCGAGWWQGVATARTTRGQAGATVGTKLPVGFDLHLAFITFRHELVKGAALVKQRNLCVGRIGR